MNIIGTRLQVMRGTAKQTGGGLMKKDLIYNKYNKIVSKKNSMKYSKKFGKIMKGGGKRFAIKDFTIIPINKTNPNLTSIDMKNIEINFDDLESPIQIYDSRNRLILQTKHYNVNIPNIKVKYKKIYFIISLNMNDYLNNIKAIHEKVNQSFKNKGYETIYRLKSYTLLNNNSNNTEVESNSNTLYFVSIKREEGKIKVHILSIDNTNIKKINKLEEIEFDKIEELLNNSNVFKTLLHFKSKNVCQLNFDTQSNKKKFNKSIKSKGYKTIYKLSSYMLLNNNSNNEEVKPNLNTSYFASIKREEGKIKVHILSIDNTNIREINKLEEIEFYKLEEIEFDKIEYHSNNSKYKYNNNYSILKSVMLKYEDDEVCILEFDTQSNKSKFQSNFIKNNNKLFPWENRLLS